MSEPPNLVGQLMDENITSLLMADPEKTWSIRVTRRNGMYSVVTKDYREDRINVELENGIIVNQHVA